MGRADGMHFLLSGLSIVFIDLTLCGDNALVIAMAVRGLPKRERRIGIIGGAAGAVVLRIALTLGALWLLEFPYVKLAGGLLVLWIALKVLLDASEKRDEAPSASRFWQAIWQIVAADIMMSLDNILAIAGAAEGDPWLIVFGLALSIPFVVFSSNLLADLMDRFPILIYLGAGILGIVGGNMIMTDSFTKRALAPSDALRYVVDGGLAAAIVGAGWLLSRRKKVRGD